MADLLSVVVCTCNHARTLAETLRCLAAQDADPASFEVLVVDNRCTDETHAVVAAARATLPGLRVVSEPTPGQVHARVRGVRESKGEWIAFVDDDNYLDPGWVSAARRFAATHPACGAFGGKITILWEAPPPPEVARRAYAFAETDLSDDDTRARRLAGDERWRLRGAGLVCRREALVGTGWLAWQANVGRVGRGTLAGDDTEIVMRVARDGWEIWYEPACQLRHAIAPDRLTVANLRALHRGFAAADGLLLGFRGRATLARWARRFALLLVRRLYWCARHAWRGWRDDDARLTALLSLDTLWGNMSGLAAVARLDRRARQTWLGRAIPPRAQPDAPFRVVHLHSGRDYGGLERMLLCLGSERATADGMEPIFALGYRQRLARELSAAGAQVEILGAFTKARPWRGLVAVVRLWRLLRRDRVDAVVCHGSSALATFGPVAKACRVPLVFWMHSDTKVRHKNAVEFLASCVRPALVVCNSAFTARSLPLLFPAPPPRVVLHCPVSPSPGDASARQRLRAELSTPATDVVVILPSRLEMWKGHGLLLDALGTVRALPGWSCWIVGGPFNAEQAETLAELREKARHLEIGDRVRFTGQREDVPDLLAAADIFCQPNLTGEPFGINAVEALFAGLPAVVSDSGGTREIVDASCGRLVPPGDSAALASALGALLRDRALRQTLAANAPARARRVSDPATILPVLRERLARLVRPGTNRNDHADNVPPVTVRSLVGAAQTHLAAVCLGSLLAAVRRPVRLAIHDDGTLDEPARAHLAETLGAACTFVDRADASEQVGELLRGHPRCRQFRDRHLFGPKLFDVPLLSGTERAVYVDSDILWTRPCDVPAFFAGDGFVAMRDLKESYAVRLRQWGLLRRAGVRLTSRFCAGMMSFDPAVGGYDLDYIEWLLGLDERHGLFDGFRFWAEQTIYAALAARAGGAAWIDPAECVVAHRREFARQRDAAVIHFAGFSRDLLGTREREIDRAALPTLPTAVLGTVPAPLCGLGRRLLSAARTRVFLQESAPAHPEPVGLHVVMEKKPS